MTLEELEKLYHEDRNKYWEVAWHRDAWMQEMKDLMEILDKVRVKVQHHQGAPTVHTTLAQVVRYPTAFCPETLEFEDLSRIKVDFEWWGHS